MSMVLVSHQKAHNRSINARRSPQNKINSGHLKSQSAMEYLLTYGWAILIIVAVLVAMFSLGVFNATEPKVQPGACHVYKSVEGASNIGECQGVWPEFVSYFNGQNSYISAQSIILTNQFSFSAWVYPTSNFNGDIVTERNGYDAVGIIVEPCGQSICFGGSVYNNANNYFFQSSPSYPYNQWYFIVYTYNYQTGGELYVNGNPTFTQSTSGPNSLISELNMMYTSLGNNYLGGYLSNVQIYTSSLSTTDIKALYQEGIGGAPIDPYDIIGWWPLNGNAQDYSGSNDNGQAVNVAYNSTWESAYTQP